MATLLRIVLSLLIAQTLGTTTAAAELAPKRATFVGTLIDVKELTCPDDRRVEPGIDYEVHELVDEHGEAIVVMCEPTSFEVTYRVDRVLAGHLSPRQIVKFRAYAWTGIPRLSAASTSLIEIEYEEEFKVWTVIGSNDVYRTATDGYAQCGCQLPKDPSARHGPSVPESACKHVEFTPKVRFSLIEASPVRIDRYRSDRNFIIRNEYAECVAGVDIADIIRAWDNAELKHDDDDDDN